MLDTLNRRLRTTRQPKGKSLRINHRDLDILALLYRYRYLSSKDLLAHIVPQSEKRFIERLSDLFHEGGLINRPVEQWECPQAHYAPLVYALSPKGKELLAAHEALPDKAVNNADRVHGGTRQQFKHTLAISQALSKAELTTRKEKHQRFVPLGEIARHKQAKGKSFALEIPVTIPISEHNPNGPLRTTIKPDGLYGIEYTETGQKLYRFFALEVDLTTPQRRKDLKHSSLLKKQLAYDAAIRSGSYKATLGIPNLTVM